MASIFTSGLGLVPLVTGLLGLFGGGGSPAPPPLVKYTMPEQRYFQGADVGSGISSADYDQFGAPRAYVAPNGSQAFSETLSPSGNANVRSSAASAQISVNVQAMDARSFLDHTTEIAQAVRQAMLTLNSVNDVVNDL